MNAARVFDMLQTLRFEARRTLGAPGLLGVVLLGGAIGAAGAIPSLQSGTRRLQDTLRLARSAPARTMTSARDAAAAAYSAENLPALFPTFAQSGDDIAVIFAQAQQSKLTLGSAQYQVETEPGGRFQRYQVLLPVKGQYGTIRHFLASVLNALPNAALQEIHAERPAVDGDLLDARLRFDLVYRATPAGTSDTPDTLRTAGSPARPGALGAAGPAGNARVSGAPGNAGAPGAPGAAAQGAVPAAARAQLAALRSPVSPDATRDPLGISSWLPPPPPPAAVPVAVAARPAAPVAPALPFAFVGALDSASAGANGSNGTNGTNEKGTAPPDKPRVFLSSGERLLIVSPGDVIDGQYKLESIAATGVVFTYLPLNKKQVLSTQGEGT